MNAVDDATPRLFPQLSDADRERMQEVAHRLLAHGSILREEAAERDLYDWCQNRTQMIEEWASLLGIKIVWQREDRLIIALPEATQLMRRLRLDETLVVLALWYDYDVEVRDKGAHEVTFTVRDFNERLGSSKFNQVKLPSETRMRDILRLLDRNNLIRLTGAENMAEAIVRVLPTIRYVIPFGDLEEWARQAERFEQGDGEGGEETAAPAPPAAEKPAGAPVAATIPFEEDEPPVSGRLQEDHDEP
ncbi:MAG TPA: DUF4194 domain-containing protein [Chthoniobacteraceae bacterium]|nr:DUF4194 domain-containing protein [Chthoniobacteraceae bacterium]